MTYKIEYGIERPPSGSIHSRVIYPWDKMKVGGSFKEFPKNGETLTGCQIRVGGAATSRATRRQEQYSTRQMDGYVRVWRIR